MLALRGLRKRDPRSAERDLLIHIDLDIAAGELIAVTGESGSGKSTLLNIIAGLDSFDAGTITLGGDDLSHLPERERSLHRRKHLGFVFQAFHLLPYLSVAENIGLPLLLTGTPSAERRRSVTRMLARIGLEERGAALPRELSGGEMQRVAIGRALVHDPLLVLADEPTGNLDADNADKIIALLRQCVDDNGCACILVTHSPRAARKADRLYQLSQSRLTLSRASPIDSHTLAEAP
jgi:putative ABC transport system ATP-binding protein